MGKKGFVVLLALLLLMTVLIGCSGSSGNNGNTASQGSPSPQGSQQASASGSAEPSGGMEKKLELSWVGYGARGKVEDNNKIQQAIEARFNVKLINKKLDIINQEQMNLMFASGELADICFCYSDPLQNYNDQLTRSIPRAMIEQYAPSYTALLDSQATGWKINQVPGNENEFLALTGYAETQRNSEWLQVYRLDWLEKAGIAPKGEVVQVGSTGDLQRIFFTKEAFTLAEEEQILDFFANGDPDGNGVKDTYGFMMMNEALIYSLVNYSGAFGFPWHHNLVNRNVEQDGKVMDPFITDNYKRFLHKLAEWYDKGYIDPEFTTLNLDKAWEKYGAGYYGAAVTGSDGPVMLPYTMDRPPAILATKNPDAKFLVTPPIIGPNGEQGVPAISPIDAFKYPVVVRKDVTDEELARILQIFDYLNFDKEAHVMANFGFENEDFTWEGEPYNSAIIAKTSSVEESEKRGVPYYAFSVVTPETAKYITPQAKNVILAYTANEGRTKLIQPYKYDRFNQTKFVELNGKYGATLATIADEYFFKAVTGEIDIDATWDAYVNNWLSNGGRQLLDELDKAPTSAELMK